jgi:hypothetical protein
VHGNYSVPWGMRDFCLIPLRHGNFFLRVRIIRQVNFVTAVTLR